MPYSDSQELLRTDYVKYGIVDLDENQMEDLVVLRSLPDGEGCADSVAGSGLVCRSMARVSMTMAELSQQVG